MCTCKRQNNKISGHICTHLYIVMSACFSKVVFECILRTLLKFLRKSGLCSPFSKPMIEFGSQIYYNNSSEGNIFLYLNNGYCKHMLSACGNIKTTPQEININY